MVIPSVLIDIISQFIPMILSILEVDRLCIVVNTLLTMNDNDFVSTIATTDDHLEHTISLDTVLALTAACIQLLSILSTPYLFKLLPVFPLTPGQSYIHL